MFLSAEMARNVMSNAAVTGKRSKFSTGVIRGAASIAIELGWYEISRWRLTLLLRLRIHFFPRPKTKLITREVDSSSPVLRVVKRSLEGVSCG